MNKQLRLSLVIVGVPFSHYVEPPLTLLSLGSYITTHGILRKKDIQLLDTDRDKTFEAIQRFQPDIVGFSVSTPAYKDAAKIARKVKRQLGSLVIIGGHHISGLPESFQKPFDIGVIGEGEGALADIISLIQRKRSYTDDDLRMISNLVFRDTQNNLVITPKRPLLTPTEIPVNQWDMLPVEHVVRYAALIHEGIVTSEPIAAVYTARGCPYRCVFCARQILWNEGRGYRAFPIHHVVDEIELLYKKYHITHIYLCDDTFTVSKERVRALITELQKRKLLGIIKVPSLFIRSNLVDEEFILLLKELGVYRVTIGIESGSNKMLRYLKSGPISVEQVKTAIRLCQKQGINVAGNFMLFSPHETRHDFLLSYKLAKWFIRQPNAVSLDLYVTIPYPGTGIWNEAVANGIINPQQLDYGKFITRHTYAKVTKYIFFRNTMSTKELDQEWKRFYRLSHQLRMRIRSTRQWKIAVKHTEEKNKKNDVIYTMKVRIGLCAKHPIRALMKLNKNKLLLKRIFYDIKNIMNIT